MEQKKTELTMDEECPKTMFAVKALAAAVDEEKEHSQLDAEAIAETVVASVSLRLASVLNGGGKSESYTKADIITSLEMLKNVIQGTIAVAVKEMGEENETN